MLRPVRYLTCALTANRWACAPPAELGSRGQHFNLRETRPFSVVPMPLPMAALPSGRPGVFLLPPGSAYLTLGVLPMSILDKRRAGYPDAEPQPIQRICLRTGCMSLTIEGAYCPRHTLPPEARTDRRSASRGWQRLYKSANYQKRRKHFMAIHPYCVVCGEPATDLDHIVPHRGNLMRFNDQSNWQALCKACHSAKTARGE